MDPSSRSQQVPSEVYRRDLSSNTVVNVSINVSEDGRCFTAITQQQATPHRYQTEAYSEDQPELQHEVDCSAICDSPAASPEAELTGPHEGTAPEMQPMHLPDSPYKSCDPQHTPCGAPPGQKPSRSSMSPHQSSETSPDVVITSMSLPASQQQCPSPSRSAHFDTQRWASCSN
jgi:hypothetical protein